MRSPLCYYELFIGKFPRWQNGHGNRDAKGNAVCNERQLDFNPLTTTKAMMEEYIPQKVENKKSNIKAIIDSKSHHRNNLQWKSSLC